MRAALFGLLLLVAGAAQAACSGSGLVWTCTASSFTASNLNSSLASASDGAVFTFAAGTYTIDGNINFQNGKGATLICPAGTTCTMNRSGGYSIGFSQSIVSGTDNKMRRISGFQFSGTTGGTNPWIWFYGQSGAVHTMRNIVIDNNTWTNQLADSKLIGFGVGSPSAEGYFYGVIYKNTVTGTNNVMLAEFYGGGETITPTGLAGTADAMVFEDNTMTFTTMNNAGLGCIDSQWSASIVWRYNTTTNCLVTSHGVTHSWGTLNFEVYGNTMIVDAGSVSAGFADGWRLFHHQGSGELLVFDNQFTRYSGRTDTPISIMHYRSWTTGTGGVARCTGVVGVDGNRSPTGTYYGYPCKRQPGRNAAAVLRPMYVWMNRWTDNGQIGQMGCEDQSETNPNTCVHHVKADRDYYNSVSASAQSSPTSPFDGTTGMGFGTFANMPTTCATGTESADAGNGGVGYWATDRGNWNGKVGATQGRLYRCSATNTWTQHYEPYKYPHPLRVQAGPAAPTNLRQQ